MPMIDKFKTCKDCPDRTISPNCHSTCEGYLYRVRKNKEIAEERKAEAIRRGYEFDKSSKYRIKMLKAAQSRRNRKRKR